MTENIGRALILGSVLVFRFRRFEGGLFLTGSSGGKLIAGLYLRPEVIKEGGVRPECLKGLRGAECPSLGGSKIRWGQLSVTKDRV
jgi:hypothetical protein